MDIRRLQKKKKQEKPHLPPQEADALRKIRLEAKQNGATLESDGEGGLPPSLVLGIMRRDGPFRCKRCGGKENLSIHHKAHLENPSPKLKQRASRRDRNDPSMLICICGSCHDRLHSEDREISEEKRDGDDTDRQG
jgi:5-methylcytosine-specific restriction endonuclease McrA